MFNSNYISKLFILLLSMSTVSFTPNIKAMTAIEEKTEAKTEVKTTASATIEVKTADNSSLSFKAIKTRLGQTVVGGYRFDLKKMKTISKTKKNRIDKSIELWVFNEAGDKSYIGQIIYYVPTEQKNCIGEFNQIYIALIEIEKEKYKKLGLGTIMTLAALQDALKTAPFCSCAYVSAISRESVGLFKTKLKFETSQPTGEIAECISTKNLPDILRRIGAKTLDLAFKKLVSV